MKKAQRNIPPIFPNPKDRDPNIVTGPQGPQGPHLLDPTQVRPPRDCGLSPDELAAGWTCVDGMRVEPRPTPDMDTRVGPPPPPPAIRPMKKGGRVKMKNGGNVPGMYNGRF